MHVNKTKNDPKKKNPEDPSNGVFHVTLILIGCFDHPFGKLKSWPTLTECEIMKTLTYLYQQTDKAVPHHTTLHTPHQIHTSKIV